MCHPPMKASTGMEGRERGNPPAIEAGRTLNDFAFGPLFTAERTHFGTAANLTRGEEWK